MTDFLGVTLEDDAFLAPTGLGLGFLEADVVDADFLEVADFTLVLTGASPAADLAFGGATLLSLEILLVVFDGVLDVDLPADLAGVFPFTFLSATGGFLPVLDLAALDFVRVDLVVVLGLVGFVLLIGLFSFDEPFSGASLTLPEGPLGNVKVPLEAPLFMERLS